MDLPKPPQSKSPYANGRTLSSDQKHDFNKTMQEFPDEKLFNPLNTVSAKAMSVQRTLGAGILEPSRIQNTPKEWGLN